MKNLGIGLCGFIFLIFLVLKLAEIGIVANWSWWWVTSPLWIFPAIILGILLSIIIFKALAAIFKEFFRRKK